MKGKSSVPKCQMGLLHFTSASHLLRTVLSLLPLKSHFCLALDLACLGRSVPQLIARMGNLCLSNPCIQPAKVSECSLVNLKCFVPLLLSNIKLISIKFTCQDQRTQTISGTAKILQTTEPICSFFLRGSLLFPR